MKEEELIEQVVRRGFRAAKIDGRLHDAGLTEAEYDLVVANARNAVLAALELDREARAAQAEEICRVLKLARGLAVEVAEGDLVREIDSLLTQVRGPR